MTNPPRKSKALIIATRAPHQLGQALERYRLKEKLTQASLAKSAGLRQATISKVENGSESTEIKTIYALCAALGLELVLRPRPTGEEGLRTEEVFSLMMKSDGET